MYVCIMYVTTDQTTQSLNQHLFRLPSNVCLAIEVRLGVLARTLPKSRVSRPKPHGSRPPNSRRAENRTSQPPEGHFRNHNLIYPINDPTQYEGTANYQIPTESHPLKPSTSHLPHRFPKPCPALDPAQVLVGGDVQPQLQIRKLGQDERARTRDKKGGKGKSAMLAAPSTSSPRIASPTSATNAFRYSNSSTIASSSPRNGKSASPALPSLRNRRDMTADTASNGKIGRAHV